MNWEGWLTLGVVVVVIFALVRDMGPPDVFLLGGVVLLGLASVIAPAEMFAGFVNEGLLTIAALFVVAAGMRETGALDSLGNALLGRTQSETGVLTRLAGIVPSVSAFINNTPVVAMLLPVIDTWCKRNRVSPSRLLIPLSYLSIVGGTCTLIGTSTNLVVNGYVIRAGKAADEANDSALAEALSPLGMFELAYLGIPFVLIGVVYLLVVGRRLLPDRKHLIERLGESSREYLVNLRVEPGGRLADMTVEGAGLRRLPGLFLIEIVRGDQIISPVPPDQILKSDDILTFTGVVTTIVDLERIPGLVPVADEGYETRAAARRMKMLCEAVVSATSPLIGANIRDANFRSMYNAAVVAVHRGGKRLRGRVGDIVLQPGDTLLLQTGPHFGRAHRNNPDFYLVSGIEDSRPYRHEKGIIAFALLGLLVLLLTTQILPVVVSAFLVAGLFVGTRCVSAGVARQSIDLQILITIGSAYGLGAALESSGAAEFLANYIVKSSVLLGPVAVLASIYILTALLTEVINNAAAVTLMFPIALATATHPAIQSNPRTFIMAITFAASTSFVTPLGYQTNLMVYGPGGYRFTDFIKVGLPLSLLFIITAITLIPRIWPLS